MKTYAVFVRTIPSSAIGSYRFIDSQWAMQGNSTMREERTAWGRVHALAETFAAFKCPFEAFIVELWVTDVAITNSAPLPEEHEQ